jgi:iron(III) transport system permease protein
LLLGLSLVVIGLALLPIAYLVIRGAGAGTAAFEYVFSPRTLEIAVNSLALAVGVAVASLVIGVPFAFLTTRTDLPARRVWLMAGLLGMVIPSYLGAIAFLEAFGPVGALQKLLAPLGVTRLPSVYGYFGAWFVITLYTFPYVVMPVRAALLSFDPAQDEAARILGLSRWRAFFRVTLPQLRPALAAGALLSMLYALSDFGVVILLRFNAFTRAIYTAYNSTFDRERAALLALTLVVMTLALVWMERKWAKTRGRGGVHAGARRVAPVIPLGRWKWPALAFCGLLVFVSAGIPLMVLTGWALNPNVTSAVPVRLDVLSWQTLVVGVLTAVAVGLAALPLAILGARTKSRAGRWLIGASYLGNVLPGLVIGLSMVYFAANYAPAIYQTLPLLVYGCAVRFLPFGVSSTQAALAGVSTKLEEAARSLGDSAGRAVWRVTVPLAWAGVLGGMALVALNAMKELPTTLLLSPIGYRTLATQAWTAYDSGSRALIGAPGLLLMLVSALSLGVLLWRQK